MRFKTIISISAVCLCLALTACGKTATDSGALTERGKTQTESEQSEASVPSASAAESVESGADLPNGVAAVVNGEQLKPEDFGYYIYNEAVVQMYAADPNADFSTFDWSAETGGKPISEKVTETAIADAVADTAFRQKAQESGYSVSEAEKTASDLVDDAIERSGEDGFKKTANALGISGAEQYKKVYTNIAVFDDVAKDFQKNPTRYISDPSVLSKYADDRGASVRQILILNDTSKGDAMTIASEVNQRAKSGEDFIALMSEYNEDSQKDKNYVYTFTRGEMVSSFEDAAFALGIDQISDIVKSDYGYHTIKRVCGAYELRNYWKAQSDIKIAGNATEMLDFNSVINMAKEAAESAEQ